LKAVATPTHLSMTLSSFKEWRGKNVPHCGPRGGKNSEKNPNPGVKSSKKGNNGKRIYPQGKAREREAPSLHLNARSTARRRTRHITAERNKKTGPKGSRGETEGRPTWN